MSCRGKMPGEDQAVALGGGAFCAPSAQQHRESLFARGCRELFSHLWSSRIVSRRVIGWIRESRPPGTFPTPVRPGNFRIVTDLAHYQNEPWKVPPAYAGGSAQELPHHRERRSGGCRSMDSKRL